MKRNVFKRLSLILFFLFCICFCCFAKDVPYSLKDIELSVNITDVGTYVKAGTTITNLGNKDISSVYMVIDAVDIEDESISSWETYKRQDLQILIPAGSSFVVKSNGIESYSMYFMDYVTNGITKLSSSEQFEIVLRDAKNKDELKRKHVRVYLSSIDYTDGTWWSDYSGEVYWEVPVYEENTPD